MRSSSAPATTAWSAPRTSPAAGCARCSSRPRDSVGGTAASEPFAGGTVNICNCDHITFRTTPVIDELGLADHGLRYLDIEPADGQHDVGRRARPWPSYHDVERTIDEPGAHPPGEVDGYRRYLEAALPAVRLILDAANDPPSRRAG